MSERAYRILLLGVLLLAAVAAVHQRFVLDDAFIAMRYARNLTEGHGLVWNPGERVEGYTSPLWTLLLALPLAFNCDPVSFVYAIGPLLLIGTLACSASLARQLLESRGAALAAVALLALNPSMIAFATGGLETQLLACLVTALFMVATRPVPLTTRRALTISVLGAACLLTRLDAAPVVGIAWLLVLYAESKRHTSSRQQAQRLVALVLPGVLVVGAYFVWEIEYYDSFLPNTFYAKTGGAQPWTDGARFVAIFFTSYMLWPSLLAVAISARRLLRTTAAASYAALALAVGASYLYVASVGGDFMEFRFFVPTLPLLFVSIVAALVHGVTRTWLRATLGATLLAGAFLHAVNFRSHDGLESVSALASHVDRRPQNWIGIGRALRAGLPENSSVKIAVTAAGAIPYYSRLPGLDMLGLTDAWVAQHGIEIAAARGHRRLAPLAYLVARGVNIVLGSPKLDAPSPPGTAAYGIRILLSLRPFPMLQLETLPREAALLEIPVEHDVVRALLLRPHPDIERALINSHWRRFALVR